MSMKFVTAPCSWGVYNLDRPNPPWKRVFKEASMAGYKGLELGAYGYLPLDLDVVSEELKKNDLNIIAGTIFDDMMTESYFENIVQQAHDICGLISKLPKAEKDEKQHYATPYLVLIDWGHSERDCYAGHPDEAPKPTEAQWNTMMDHFRTAAKIAWEEYGVRPVIHPHAGGYVEFGHEIDRLADEIPYEMAGLCLDTGHLYYSKMDPAEWIKKYADRLDYVHFKDVDLKIYNEVMDAHCRFLDACDKFVMCSIGKGAVDYPSVLKALKEIDYNGYICLELERDSKYVDQSLADVTESLNYLKSIGF